MGGVKLLIPLLENTSLSFAGETDKLGVALFLQLLYAFLDKDNQNLFLLNNGVAIVGALMEEVIYGCYSNIHMMLHPDNSVVIATTAAKYLLPLTIL